MAGLRQAELDGSIPRFPNQHDNQCKERMQFYLSLLYAHIFTGPPLIKPDQSPRQGRVVRASAQERFLASARSMRTVYHLSAGASGPRMSAGA